jgi:hypothetical protein
VLYYNDGWKEPQPVQIGFVPVIVVAGIVGYVGIRNLVLFLFGAAFCTTIMFTPFVFSLLRRRMTGFAWALIGVSSAD